MATSLDEWKMTLATSALLVCMLWDIVLDIAKDYVRVPSWVPGRLFVLNALTILILGNVDIEKGNALSPSEVLEVLVHNQLKMDAARLTMCVFVGCILTGITVVQTEGGWSSLAALFVSLFFHVATEIYALQKGNSSTAEAGPWFVWSSAILSLGASSLLVLLGQVMLFCKVARRLDAIDLIYKELSEDEKSEGDGWETLRREVMKSWFAFRLWSAQYYILSSIFIPGATVIVTLCVVVMAAKVGCNSSLLHQSNGGNNLTFYLQCIFILVGSILMLCRWLRPVLYCYEEPHFKEHFFKIPSSTLVPIFVLMKPLLGLETRLKSFLHKRKFTLRGILIFLSCAVVLLLLLCALILLTLLSSFCFVCWYFSKLVFDYMHKESVLANAKNSKYQSMLDAYTSNEEFQYIFWKLNKKSFDRINSKIDEVSKIEENCKGLLSIMGTVRLSESQQLRLHDHKEHSWMGAVSRIFKFISDANVGVDIKDALDAYKETKTLLMFGDCPDNMVVDPLNMFDTSNLRSLIDSMAYEADMLGIIEYEEREDRVLSRDEEPGLVDKLVKDINDLGEQTFETPLITRHDEERVDRVLSRDEERGRVDKLVKDINDLGGEMFKTPLIIRHDEECSHYNLEELGKMLRSLMGRLIVSSILEVPDVLVKYSKKWAENLDEEKIERGIEIVGKVSALLEKLVEEDRNRIHPEMASHESGARASESGDIEAAVGPSQ